MMLDDETASKLSSRRYLYAFFSVFLGNEPTDELAVAIDGPLLLEAAAFMEEGKALCRPLAAFLEAVDGGDRDREALIRDYRKLFVGPGTLAAMPWESIHVSSSPLLFQEETLEVRRIYRQWGYLPALYPKVADDHIALETAFLEKLACRSCEALEQGSEADLLDTLRASLRFLEDHLAVWVGRYDADVRGAMGDSPYVFLVSALEALVEEDAQFLRLQLSNEAVA